MIINHNISANNTYRQFGTANKAQSGSMEKLSSGLRINKAGDDAAGLAISEKMRGQIRGLDMAGKNAQDGVSMLQTAEGALNETHSILQRMRELSVQASNDTNTGDDRNEIQKEINQLNSEINRISDTTEFNTKKLLNGGLGATGTSDTPANVDVKSVSGMVPGTYDVVITAAASKAVTAASTAAYAADADVTAVGAFNGGVDKDIAVNGIQIDTTGVTTKAGLLTALNDKSAESGFTASWGGNNLIFTANDFGSGKTFTVTGADAALVNGGALTDGADAAITITNNTTNVTSAITGVGQSVIFGTAEFTAKGANASTATIAVAKSGASLHIGANENQTMLVDVNQMDTSTLGNATNKIKDINVLTTAGAETAITTVDDAIKQVSAERSKLGAFQNRLDHTINNLSTSSENLTAAESRIRDVDMAKEMMTNTKNSILSQAAQAMLAQANQAPKQVLQLLQ